MGCNSSKETTGTVQSPTNDNKKKKEQQQQQSSGGTDVEPTGHPAAFAMMASVESVGIRTMSFWGNVGRLCQRDPLVCSYVDGDTGATPLHLACSLIDYDDGATDNDASPASVISVIRTLLQQSPEAAGRADNQGRVPLHCVLAGPKKPSGTDMPEPRWKTRTLALKALIASDPEVAVDYCARSDVVFDTDVGGVTPIYHALQCVDDDFESPSTMGPYIGTVLSCNTAVVRQGNDGDADKPLSLLYRRFTRQFDLSEKFFPGDNSRPEVVKHRHLYKMAAGNTWRIIEEMLRPDSTNGAAAEGTKAEWYIVHRAIQVETPPDLLRYIVETNSGELAQPDEAGNLPLHYAAKSRPPESAFPSFYTKFVIDELLYKFPEGAGMADGDGKFPLTLAVNSGKQWIGGGVKSLYDAYPEALQQIDVNAHESLKKALELEQATTIENEQGEQGTEQNEDGDATGEGQEAGIIPDEHHDGIMMVQRDDIDVPNIVFAMWAHEEDAGVQMLGCMAIAKKALKAKGDDETILRIAVSSLPAVVNSMKAHPNEAVIQDKASAALRRLSTADNKREVSFVASGAIAAIVGAMQAHVGDPAVQVEACAAVAEVVLAGGTDRATVVASVSGLTALINALAAHPDNEQVQIEGLRALKAITDHSEANLPDLPRSQTEPLLMAAKTEFPESCGPTVDALLARLSQ